MRSFAKALGTLSSARYDGAVIGKLTYHRFAVFEASKLQVIPLPATKTDIPQEASRKIDLKGRVQQRLERVCISKLEGQQIAERMELTVLLPEPETKLTAELFAAEENAELASESPTVGRIAESLATEQSTEPATGLPADGRTSDPYTLLPTSEQDRPCAPTKAWRTFTQDEVLAFCQEVGDNNPIHTTDTPIVPALLILEALLESRPWPQKLEMRFLAPVQAGRAVHLETTQERIAGFCDGKLFFRGKLSQ